MQKEGPHGSHISGTKREALLQELQPEDLPQHKYLLQETEKRQEKGNNKRRKQENKKGSK